MRWPHAKQGLISPARFISIAEERGLVIPLGEWVLRRACRDGKRWPGLRDRRERVADPVPAPRLRRERTCRS